MVKGRTSSEFRERIRIKPDVPPPAATAVELRPCAAPGCKEEGAYRVTKSREELGKYLWLCLAHARAHNESWDYFKGMSEQQIESFRNDAITGHRPTWPLGKRAARLHNTLREFDFDNTFGTDNPRQEPPSPRRPERQVTRLQQTAFDTLNLEPSATLNEIKARYKELVKRFHPDANGGDRGAEERLKQVIKAYGVLRASGLT
jgi:hypothetical protein